ncbi:VanZ family protein [Imbroritus primus]|uniref:VanZ family protein n=1 Tax=Imbroritus primus TaxID=3058603 RepID=UPI003D1611F0
MTGPSQDPHRTVAPTAPLVRQASPLSRVGLLCFVALVVYASLYPFSGWTDTGVSPLAYLRAPLPRYITNFDLITNVLGYAPLGALLVLSLHPRIRGVFAVLLAVLSGALLSGTLEAVQTWLPNRIPSNVDLGTNVLGTFVGALLMAPFASRLIDRGPLRTLRHTWFEPESSFAIALLFLWPFTQVAPQEYLFGLGGALRDWLLTPEPVLVDMLRGVYPDIVTLHERIQMRPEGLDQQELLEALLTASSWLGTALMASVAMRRGAPMLRILMGILAATLLIKAGASELQYPNEALWGWFSDGARLGLVCGSLLLVLALRLHRGARGLLAMVLLIGVIIMTNVLPPNPYSWASGQSWWLGRYIHFNGLSRWLGFIWPFLAACYLAWRLEQYGLQRRRIRAARRSRAH